MDSQELYLKKIENDVTEKIYDLLIRHLDNVHKVLPKTENNKEKIKILRKHLYKALEDMKKDSNQYNYLMYYRYSIKIINTMLSYKPDEKHLKKIKLSILNRFSSETIYDNKEKIPLRSQMTELRITYDTGYLIYLLEKQFMPRQLWDKAIYCLMAIELVEPDHENINRYKTEIQKHLKRDEISYTNKEDPIDYLIVLDTNIVLNKILYDVDNYKIQHNDMEKYNSIMEKWGNNNKFIITDSVKTELEKNLKYSINTIEDTCRKNKHFNKKHIIQTIEKRFNNIIKKYYYQTEVCEYDLSYVEKFYSNYLGNLYDITLEKIENKKLSKKLKKLADREGLLPEVGDLKLIFDAKKLKEKNDKVAILSNDKDLYVFNDEIERCFEIRVFK